MTSKAGRWVRRGLIVVGVALLLFGGVAEYFHWWDRYIETGLGRWAVAEVAERSHGVYRLVLGDLDFRPVGGSMSFDSAVVVTDTALNRALGAPFPTLSVRAVGCRISKVSVLRLMLAKRFEARAMGCGVVSTAIVLAPPGADPPPAQADSPRRADSVPGGARPPRQLQAPLGIRIFEISNIAFPALQFSLRRVGLKGEASFEIEQARFMGDEAHFNPTATPGSPEAFWSRGVRLEASNLRFRPTALSQLALGAIDIGLTDSTLSLGHLTVGPTVTDEEWKRNQKVRSDRIKFSLDTLVAVGLQYRTLVRTNELHLRRLTLRGARLDVLSDKRLPSGPSKAHDGPQRNAQQVAPAVRADTIEIDSSEVGYSERSPKGDRPGRVDFKALSARITSIHLPSSGTPLTIDVSAKLMGEGALAVHASVPLDAPDFRFTLTGRLGSMPASAFNGFLTATQPVQLKNGQIDSVVFAMNATGGHNATTLTPYYRDLGVDVINRGGVGGFLKAGLIEVGANKLKVRSRNPDSPKDPPRTAKVSRRYEPTQSYISFLWLSIRDGLLKAIIK